MMPVVVSVDIGTSSTKAVACSEQGEIIASARKSYGFLPSEPGYQEQDPVELLHAVLDTIGEVLEKIHLRATVSGFSFSCAMHGLMAIGKDHRPLTGVITWADNRSSAEAASLKKLTGGTGLYERTGLPIHSMTPLSKLCWLRNHLPGIFDRAIIFTGFKEYLFYHLFGRYLLDESLAAATGLFDVHRLRWDPEALSLAGISEERLPTIVSALHAEYDLQESLRLQWGLPKPIPFFIGSSDGCMANLGTAAIREGDMALTIGTSGAVRMARSAPAPDTGKKTFNYPLLPGLFINGGPVNNGGILLKWFAEHFLDRSFSEASDFSWFLDEASKAEPGCGGLICLPYFNGERAPVWDDGACGIFYGVRLHHRRTHFMRAIVEGISMTLYQVSEILKERNGPPLQIFASGGFIQSPQWVQIMADIFRLPIQVTSDADASATGAAMLGWIGINGRDPVEMANSWVRIRETYDPAVKNSTVYQDNFRIFSELYERNRF